MEKARRRNFRFLVPSQRRMAPRRCALRFRASSRNNNRHQQTSDGSAKAEAATQAEHAPMEDDEKATQAARSAFGLSLDPGSTQVSHKAWKQISSACRLKRALEVTTAQLKQMEQGKLWACSTTTKSAPKSHAEDLSMSLQN